MQVYYVNKKAEEQKRNKKGTKGNRKETIEINRNQLKIFEANRSQLKPKETKGSQGELKE